MEITVRQLLEGYQAITSIGGCPKAKLSMQLGRNRRKIRQEVEIYQEAIRNKMLALGGYREIGNSITLPNPTEVDISEEESEQRAENVLEFEEFDRELRKEVVDVDLRPIELEEFLDAGEGVEFHPEFFDYCEYLIRGGE